MIGREKLGSEVVGTQNGGEEPSLAGDALACSPARCQGGEEDGCLDAVGADERGESLALPDWHPDPIGAALDDVDPVVAAAVLRGGGTGIASSASSLPCATTIIVLLLLFCLGGTEEK